MTDKEAREIAEAHWNFIQKIFETGGLGYKPMDKLLYIEAFVHGIKHGTQAVSHQGEQGR